MTLWGKLFHLSGDMSTTGCPSELPVHQCKLHREPPGGISGLNAVVGLQYFTGITAMPWDSSHIRGCAVDGYRQLGKDMLGGGRGISFCERAAGMHGALPWERYELVDSLWVRNNTLLKLSINKLGSKLYMLPVRKSCNSRSFIVRKRTLMLPQDVQTGACDLSQ